MAGLFRVFSSNTAHENKYRQQLATIIEPDKLEEVYKLLNLSTVKDKQSNQETWARTLLGIIMDNKDRILSSMEPLKDHLGQMRTGPLFVKTNRDGEDDYITVFSNLIVDYPYLYRFYSFPVSSQDCLPSGLQIVENMFPDPTKSMLRFLSKIGNTSIPNRQYHNFYNAKRYLKRTEKTTIGRLLLQTQAPKHYTEAELLAISNKWIASFRPMELVYCKDQSDYVKMYESTGPDSCMRYTAERRWAWLVREHGVHPTGVFVGNPFIQGVYTLYGDTVVARTFLYTDPSTKKTHFGRIYPASGTIRNCFTNTLQKAGYTPLPTGVFKARISWDAPLFSHGDVLHCQVPYLDNLGREYYGVLGANEEKIKIFMNYAAQEIPVAKGERCIRIESTQNGALSISEDDVCIYCGARKTTLIALSAAHTRRDSPEYGKKICPGHVGKFGHQTSRYFKLLSADGGIEIISRAYSSLDFTKCAVYNEELYSSPYAVMKQRQFTIITEDNYHIFEGFLDKLASGKLLSIPIGTYLREDFIEKITPDTVQDLNTNGGTKYAYIPSSNIKIFILRSIFPKLTEKYTLSTNEYLEKVRFINKPKPDKKLYIDVKMIPKAQFSINSSTYSLVIFNRPYQAAG